MPTNQTPRDQDDSSWTPKKLLELQKSLRSVPAYPVRFIISQYDYDFIKFGKPQCDGHRAIMGACASFGATILASKFAPRNIAHVTMSNGTQGFHDISEANGSWYEGEER